MAEQAAPPKPTTSSVYPTQQAAVDALAPGWIIIGAKPATRMVPNPNRVKVDDPAQIEQQYGTELSIQSADGTQRDRIVVGEAPSDQVKGGIGTTVLEGPTKNLATSGQGGKPSDPSKWQTIYRVPGDVSSGAVAQWDPVNNEYHPVAAAPDAKPTGQYTPVYREPDKPDSGVVALVDTGDKSFHPVAGDPGAKPSGQYSNVTTTDSNGKTHVVGVQDTGDHSFHPVSVDSATQKRIVSTPNKIFVFDDEGNVTSTVDIDKNSPYQAVVLDGVPYSFDPNTGKFSKPPGDWQHPPIKDANGSPMQWDEAQGKYVYPPGVSPANTLSVNTQAPYLEWYDDKGNLVKRVPNENYAGRQQPAQVQQSTVAPYIQQWNPKTGQWEWVENKGRVTAGAALQNMASTLSGQVVDGKISVDEAKTLIDAAHQTMSDAITAATTTLDYTARQATTGAGLLQQRAATAQGMLGQVLGLAQGAPHMAATAPGLGAELVGGIQNWTAGLMGGQPTLDAAARMVQAADPQGSPLAPHVQTAVGVLQQMLERYKTLTGNDHPAVAAQAAAQQSSAAGGVVAPSTVAAMRAAGAPSVPPANPFASGGLGPVVAPFGPQAFRAPAAVAPPNPLSAGGLGAVMAPFGPQSAPQGFTAPAAPTVVMNF